MKLNERFDFILSHKGRKVYDTLHSFSRFFERGLKHLRPKTYAAIVNQFHLNTSDNEKNDDFENKMELIRRAYPDQYRNYWNLYVHTLKKGIEKIISEGDRIDQYIIVSKKFGLGIQIEWRYDRKDPGKPHGFTATSLSPDTMKWAKGDKKIFVERYKLTHPKTVFRESADPEEVFHTFDWPDNLSESMFPAQIILDEGRLYRTFEILEV